MNQLTDEQIDALLREVADVEVPEPSPLFWERFGARVNAAIDAATQDRRTSWVHAGPLGWIAAAAVVVVAVVGFYVTRPAGERHAQPPVTAQTQGTDISGSTEALGEVETADIETDEAWAVVRSFAAELQYDEARDAGVMPRAGAVDRAVTELSDEERAELARLIEDELRRTGA